MRMHIAIALFLLIGSISGATLTVCQDGCNYNSIQEAMHAANHGDIVEVQSGMYFEEIKVYKNVTLKGIDTGNGRPSIQSVYLCGHPDSILAGISVLFMNYGYPSLEESIIANDIRKSIDASPLGPPGSSKMGEEIAESVANQQAVTLKELETSRNQTIPVQKAVVAEKTEISSNQAIPVQKAVVAEKTEISSNQTMPAQKAVIAEKPEISSNQTMPAQKAVIAEKPEISQSQSRKNTFEPMAPYSEMAQKILYIDDFSRSQPIIYPSDYHKDFTARYQARKFYLIVLKPNYLSIYDTTKQTAFKDFSLEVEAAKENAPNDAEYGVVLRRINANSYYLFWISESGFFGLEKLDNGQSVDLIPSTKTSIINTGNHANEIKAECYGNHFVFKVNEEEIGNITDDSFSTGEIGFMVRTHSSAGVEVSFDNLQIYA